MGIPECQYRLGKLTEDRTEAAKWYRKAAEQGHLGAQSTLVKCYQDGDGVARSASDAAKWSARFREHANHRMLHQLGMRLTEKEEP